MGQALRRATSRVRASNLEPPPPSSPSSSNLKNVVVEKQPQPVRSVEPKIISKSSSGEKPDFDGEISKNNTDNVLEERDPGYDAMLSQMVGRIKSKPGGKLEMGEAFVVEKYNRPMPKLRNTKPDYSLEERPVAPGTLNVAQLRQMLLLHQGKAEDHNGPMDARQIAQQFRIDVMQVEKILQFVSLPPEDNNSKQKDK